jgi:cyclopropane fatty-acyl-phospholipid synthase-like methyltransferase
LRPDEDVPSPIDFHDLAQARSWEAETTRNRPYRPQFFAAFAEILNAHFERPLTLLELGSGPGHLAEHLLSHCGIGRYVALDFSLAMHQIAEKRLSSFSNKPQFMLRDFRTADWGEGLGLFDAVVTLQAAHETRHKRHLPLLLARARQCIAPQGLLLYCDHYAGEGKHPDLFLAAEEQPRALQEEGFIQIHKQLDIAGMALFSARNPATV